MSADQRNVLLVAYRGGKDVRAARRAHIVLLLADGWSYREVRAITFASFDLIRDCVLSFQQGGSAAVLREDQEQDAAVPRWLLTIQRWLQSRTPQDFGYFRSRWSCAALRETLAWQTGIRLSGETIRRGLARLVKPDEFAALAKHLIENVAINGEVVRLDGALRMGPK